jgi:hypothetical protein
MAEIRADEAHRFIFVTPFDLLDFFQPFLAEYITADAVDSIGGVRNYPAPFKYFDYFKNSFALGIVSIYFNWHKLSREKLYSKHIGKSIAGFPP